MGKDYKNDSEKVHMQLLNGDSVMFNRSYGSHRFTDNELELLMSGREIKLPNGTIGSLDFLEYNGYEYYGFAPWDADSYNIKDAPFPKEWNGYTFSDYEEEVLRRGDKLLILAKSSKTGSHYGLHVSFGITMYDGNSKWSIIPHFDEFNQDPSDFTRLSCLFKPSFSGYDLSQKEIDILRQGKMVKFKGKSKTGSVYTCDLSLELDDELNRWRIIPNFK